LIILLCFVSPTLNLGFHCSQSGTRIAGAEGEHTIGTSTSQLLHHQEAILLLLEGHPYLYLVHLQDHNLPRRKIYEFNRLVEGLPDKSQSRGDKKTFVPENLSQRQHQRQEPLYAFVVLRDLVRAEGMRPFSFAITRQIEVNLTSKASFHMSRSRRWRTKNTASRQEARAASAAAKMENKPDYSNWTHESLVERVTQLEKELKDKNQRLVRSTSTPGLY
jgi:hypothetical protein